MSEALLRPRTEKSKSSKSVKRLSWYSNALVRNPKQPARPLVPVAEMAMSSPSNTSDASSAGTTCESGDTLPTIYAASPPAVETPNPFGARKQSTQPTLMAGPRTRTRGPPERSPERREPRTRTRGPPERSPERREPRSLPLQRERDQNPSPTAPPPGFVDRIISAPHDSNCEPQRAACITVPEDAPAVPAYLGEKQPGRKKGTGKKMKDSVFFAFVLLPLSCWYTRGGRRLKGAREGGNVENYAPDPDMEGFVAEGLRTHDADWR